MRHNRQATSVCNPGMVDNDNRYHPAEKATTLPYHSALPQRRRRYHQRLVSRSRWKMKTPVILIVLFMLASCQKQQDDYWIKVYKGEFDQVGAHTGYINRKGDTVIAIGKYQYCYTDTLREFAIVTQKTGKTIGIDRNEKELFEVFWFDNGPDPAAEGVFRIVKDGKIGYANLKGEIVITPQYACAFPFEKGKAQVAYQCETIPEGEHSRWESQTWVHIDKQGNIIAE